MCILRSEIQNYLNIFICFRAVDRLIFVPKSFAKILLNAAHESWLPCICTASTPIHSQRRLPTAASLPDEPQTMGRHTLMRWKL